MYFNRFPAAQWMYYCGWEISCLKPRRLTESLYPMNVGRILIGKPLETKELIHQAISKPVGLAVFASDALSSTAYATQEMLIILSLAGGSSILFGLSIP